MERPSYGERLSNAVNTTIGAVIWGGLALSALLQDPWGCALVVGVGVAIIATLYARQTISRNRRDPSLPTDETSSVPQPCEARMDNRPPLLPVLIGVGAVGFGLVNGLFFTVWAANVLLNSPEQAPPAASLVPGLLVLMDVFTLLQIPAGVGMLVHRPWGKKLASAMALGTVITGLLGTGLGTMGISGYPDVVMATFLWGFGTGLAWAIVLGVACRSRSMKVVFGEAAARDAPPVSVG